MPIPIASTLGMLGDNLRRRSSALPMSRHAATAWAQGLDLPRGGETVLYTGQMWQMVPAVNAMSRQLAKYETRGGARLFRFARSMNRLVNLTPFLARTTRTERRAYNERLRNIARLLRSAGVAFGYLYEDDLYAGGLAHDEGLDDAFAVHANRVAATLRRNGVRRVITVDPHTTNMLRSVYPTVVPGFDVRVESYLEVLADHVPRPRALLGSTVALHDSCVYARYEGVVDQPRALLKASGVRVVEPEMTGRLTFCCGGPLESLFPGKSAEIARRRLEQLKTASPSVVTACPLCLANLSRVAPPGMTVRDISDYLAEACLPRDGAPLSAQPSAPVVSAASGSSERGSVLTH